MDKDFNKTVDLLLTEQENNSTMLSKTTHDLNNSLAVFLGQVSILELLNKKDSLGPEKISSIVEKLMKSVDKFKVKLDDLKSYYKVPLNDDEYNTFYQVLISLNYYFANQFYNKHIEFELDVDEKLKERKSTCETSQLLLALKLITQVAINHCEALEQSKLVISLSDNAGKTLITLKDNRDLSTVSDQKMDEILQNTILDKISASYASSVIKDSDFTFKSEITI